MLTTDHVIRGPEGNGVVLRVATTFEGDQVVVSIERAGGVGEALQTIRLDSDSWDELCDLKYAIHLKKSVAKEAPGAPE